MELPSIKPYTLTKPCDLITEKEERILNNFTVWKIDYDDKWKTIMEDIEQCSVKLIKINTALPPPWQRNLLESLLSIGFKQLIELNLSNQNLQQLQLLQKLNIPTLQYISLKKNNISNIKVLRKMYFPHLRQIQLDQNQIFDISSLPQIFSRQSLVIILANEYKTPMFLQHRTNYTTNPIVNYMPIFKMKYNHKCTLKPNLRTINQLRFTKLLQNKYVE